MTKPNKAKCARCNDIIESFHQTDYVTCGCGEISVDGGPQALRCAAKDWNNFIRIDEYGNERRITLKNEEAPTEQQETQTEPPSAQALIIPPRENARMLLDEMIKNYESLPHDAMHSFATNADVLSVLYLVGALFKPSGNVE